MKVDFYIVIKEFNEKLAKRQPWYSIKKLKEDLEYKNYIVEIVSSLEEIPKHFDGKIIKVFSLSDLWNKKLQYYNNNLYFFITFPMYNFGKFLNIPKRILLENWKDLKRVFIFSLIPKIFVKNVLKKAKYNIAISDRSYEYLENKLKLQNLGMYYPFKVGNWGTIHYKQEIKQTNKVIGYFGPPFTTRYFDEVINFFMWINKKRLNFLKKIITRIERNELKLIEDKYLSKIKNDNNVIVLSGFLSREDLNKHLQEIDLLILPFRIVMSELPIVVLEALELEIPVVTTKDSGIYKLVDGIEKVKILDKFDNDNYKEVIEFLKQTDKNKKVFNKILLRMNEINKKTLEKICQK